MKHLLPSSSLVQIELYFLGSTLLIQDYTGHEITKSSEAKEKT